MTALKALVQWFLRTYPSRLIQAYINSQASNYGSGLAFTSFICMFPLILGLLSILGLATQSPAARQQILDASFSFFPPSSHNELSSGLTFVARNASVLAVLGLAGLLWSGSSLFVGMEWTLGRMVGSRQRDFLRQRAMSFLMTVVFVVAIVGSIFVNSVLALVPGTVFVGPLAGLLVWFGFMIAVYRCVPNRTYRLRQMWPGVVIAGTLMEVLTLLWPLYAGLTHGFTTYGKTFAVFFLLATWLYFLAQFILIGAVANRMHGGVPTALGLVATPEPEPLETEATRAADQFSGRPARP